MAYYILLLFFSRFLFRFTSIWRRTGFVDTRPNYSQPSRYWTATCGHWFFRTWHILETSIPELDVVIIISITFMYITVNRCLLSMLNMWIAIMFFPNLWVVILLVELHKFILKCKIARLCVVSWKGTWSLFQESTCVQTTASNHAPSVTLLVEYIRIVAEYYWVELKYQTLALLQFDV